MKPVRTLAVRRERLAELDAGELRGVIGGTHIATDCDCLTHGNTCDACPTPTLPLNPCLRSLIVGEDQTSPCA